MSIEVVTIDIDDVLRPSTLKITDAYAAHKGMAFEYPSISKEGVMKGMVRVFSDALPTLEQEAIMMEVDGLICEADFMDVEPEPGSVEGVSKIAEKHRAYAVSSCPQSIKSETEEWIDKHYGGMFEAVRVIGGDCWGHGATIDKFETLEELGSDCHIDDLVRHTIHAKQVGALAILYGNYPWNQVDQLPDHVTRCENWSAVEAFFDAR